MEKERSVREFRKQTQKKVITIGEGMIESILEEAKQLRGFIRQRSHGGFE